jgi:hypothetical protein
VLADWLGSKFRQLEPVYGKKFNIMLGNSGLQGDAIRFPNPFSGLFIARRRQAPIGPKAILLASFYRERAAFREKYKF